MVPHPRPRSVFTPTRCRFECGQITTSRDKRWKSSMFDKSRLRAGRLRSSAAVACTTIAPANRLGNQIHRRPHCCWTSRAMSLKHRLPTSFFTSPKRAWSRRASRRATVCSTRVGVRFPVALARGGEWREWIDARGQLRVSRRGPGRGVRCGLRVARARVTASDARRFMTEGKRGLH